MIEAFQPADYVIAGLAVISAVLGLFRGFSGMLAFCLATAAAGFVGSFGWRVSEPWFEQLWARGLAVLVALLVAFGIVRALVRRFVNGLLAQPADAIFGFLTGLVVVVLVLAGWAFSGLYLEYSFLASELARYVG